MKKIIPIIIILLILLLPTMENFNISYHDKYFDNNYQNNANELTEGIEKNYKYFFGIMVDVSGIADIVKDAVILVSDVGGTVVSVVKEPLSFVTNTIKDGFDAVIGFLKGD